MHLRRAALAVGVVGWVGWSASALAQPPVSPPPVAPPAPTAATTPPAAAPVAMPAAAAPAPPTAAAEGSAPFGAGPVPTADETAAASDHDAVVGHVGVEVRRFDPGPMPLALRDGLGCPAGGAGTPACEVTMGALAARYWWTRNMALNVGAAFALGSGRTDTRSLDTYLGIGPIVGLSLLLGNWRHLAVSASPELALVWFKPAVGSDGSTTVLALHGVLEAEVHLGFIGVPALSVGLLAGLGFEYESVAASRVWSVGVLGGNSVWGALSNLFVRYYL
ncbi:MAG TPA: hypothetical protein VN903_13650 [Polyangia bacterium]|jgi:hypothetical protein|nr:hypothetical protein [Polyangia bacterium]